MAFIGAAGTTVRNYLELLCRTFVVRQLTPWAENVGKRIVRSPKIYISDSGLLHALLGLETPRDLEGHPKLGASWEGFLTEQVLRRLGAHDRQAHFWAAHSGPELDLLVTHGRRRLGFEFKRTDAPRVTASMKKAQELLRLDSLTVVHAGPHTFPLEKEIRAVAAADLLTEVRSLRP